MISTSLPLPLASSPVAVQPSPAPAQKLPVPADQYTGSVDPHTWVKGADLSTYQKVGSALGAATGAFSSHLVVPLAGAVAGFGAGAAIAGPIGALVGGAIGLAGGALVQIKTLLGRKAMGVAGGVAGAALGTVAKALHIPLRSDHIEETKNYSFAGMVSHLGTINYTSHPRISAADADAFIAQLQPGDIVMTNDEASTIFSLAVAAVNGEADFNHALVYVGDGKTIEARTVTHGVAEGVLRDVLQRKHHAVAVRPHYQPGQADGMVAASRALIGRPYDFKFRLNNDALYCSEMVYEAVKTAAPQVQFVKHPFFSRQVVLPGDFLHTSQADVVAEVGKDRTLVNSYLAKFV